MSKDGYHSGIKSFRHLAKCLNGWLVKRPKELSYLLKHKDLYRLPSYYPEEQGTHKSSSRIFWEQVRTILKYGKPNKYYFSYGLDVKTQKEQDEYLQFEQFFLRICNLNHSPRFNCCCILRDKMLFNIFANGIGIKTPQNILYSTNGQLYDYASRKEVKSDRLLQLGVQHLFCKVIDGECGRGVFRIDIVEGEIIVNGKESTPEEAYSLLTNGRYLAQGVVTQHPQMSALHPESINTLRIITVRSMKDCKIRVWPSIMRIGTGASIVDNTSQGGLCVGINYETAHLKQWGFYKPQFGRKTERHPDSGIVFIDFEIPYLQEALNQAIYFHSMLPGIQSIGWDIAIGENGPIFIEGNDNWEINGPQICNGGLKEMFLDQMYK